MRKQVRIIIRYHLKTINEKSANLLNETNREKEKLKESNLKDANKLKELQWMIIESKN